MDVKLEFEVDVEGPADMIDRREEWDGGMVRKGDR
jgi:hypothetical protein